MIGDTSSIFNDPAKFTILFNCKFFSTKSVENGLEDLLKKESKGIILIYAAQVCSETLRRKLYNLLL